MTTKSKKTNFKQPQSNESQSVRLYCAVAQSLQNEVSILNKNKKGSRKINISDLVELLLRKFSDEDKLTLLSQTVTSLDRQKVAYAKYQKTHKNTSKDDFLDLIQYGEIQINDYLPDEMKKQRTSKNINSLISA
ncbi:MAG: hypothetical protein ACPGJV_14755 [Bacteriovoracaceae bacterium]